MGLSLQFWIGNCESIAAAIQEAELDRLDDPAVVSNRADLSLHIDPKDLNLLSRQIGVVSNQNPIDLRPYLDVIVDETDRGLLAIDSEWVSYAAAVPPERVPEVVTLWFAAMREEYDDPETIVTEAAILAVRELISLCKIAKQNGYEVLHSWFL